jgi:hypothetical protein
VLATAELFQLPRDFSIADAYAEPSSSVTNFRGCGTNNMCVSALGWRNYLLVAVLRRGRCEAAVLRGQPATVQPLDESRHMFELGGGQSGSKRLQRFLSAVS